MRKLIGASNIHGKEKPGIFAGLLLWFGAKRSCLGG